MSSPRLKYFFDIIIWFRAKFYLFPARKTISLSSFRECNRFPMRPGVTPLHGIPNEVKKSLMCHGIYRVGILYWHLISRLLRDTCSMLNFVTIIGSNRSCRCRRIYYCILFQASLCKSFHLFQLVFWSTSL